MFDSLPPFGFFSIVAISIGLFAFGILIYFIRDTWQFGKSIDQENAALDHYAVRKILRQRDQTAEAELLHRIHGMLSRAARPAVRIFIVFTILLYSIVLYDGALYLAWQETSPDDAVLMAPTSKFDRNLQERHDEIIAALKNRSFTSNTSGPDNGADTVFEIFKTTLIFFGFLATAFIGIFLLYRFIQNIPGWIKGVISIGVLSAAFSGSYNIIKVDNPNFDLGKIPADAWLLVVSALSLICAAATATKLFELTDKSNSLEWGKSLPLTFMVFSVPPLLVYAMLPDTAPPPPPAPTEISLKLASTDARIHAECGEEHQETFKYFPLDVSDLDNPSDKAKKRHPALPEKKREFDQHLKRYLESLSTRLETGARLHSLILIGQADQTPLGEGAEHDSNAQLAQARADWVKQKIESSRNDVGKRIFDQPPAILVVYAGPTKIDVDPKPTQEDRSVRVCTIWSREFSGKSD